ncbi:MULTISPECIES: phospholipid-binding protein MlaC [unclassified Ruegeria]|uniref:MlaC/ttg2D family ABC transporter substrate-binding protein n=1 Tax=unclassified Ruegeria TaxID=2625375 RepID=UPI0014881E2D|nr:MULTISPECIES: ABC transporter substrate-binding protein [unclassified Ruegeria]NOD48793.1 ABC transporter substrate-binding protein [Ruegeria sp. HKCCD5849]NOD51904.1 ABC transporter substrate-binding protein [Ruegeria sp. HKCCD5851]NOD66562.1 ABC transporter substrate-binding protein [Ruegeria sp. HKCCD7303]NOE33951.1 ABC transporter substrate-binding protein [Ruegeria sp. HKCCD7318]
MPNNELNRRHFIASSLALALLPMPALAQTEAAAKALVNSVVADINRVIDSGKSEKAMLRDFEKIFVQYGDVPIMARYALGADARTASPAQLKKFTKAFQGYISRKYGRRFREFIGGEVDVRNARKIKAGYEVRTMVKLRGSAPFDVTFLVSDKSGRDKFYNMFIEGVNLLLTERTEIGAMLDARKGNLDQLIRDLNKTG